MGVVQILQKSGRLALRHLTQRRNIVAVLIFFILLFSLFRSRSSIGQPKVQLPQIPYLEIPPDDFAPATQASKFNPVILNAGKNSIKDLCDSFPNHLVDRIQPVLKIGHADVGGPKLKGQFASSSACFAADELLVFSDWEEVVHGHKTIDALAGLSTWYYNSRRFSDWKIYEAMKAAERKGELEQAMREKRFNGWKLDKYKFLPSIERAWNLKPNKDFYVFYETDT